MTNLADSRSRACCRRRTPTGCSSIRCPPQWGQSVDHARGDRPALRGAPVPFGHDGMLERRILSLNPNDKIPAIIDPDGPGGKPPRRCGKPARSCSISPTRPASCIAADPPGARKPSNGCSGRWAAIGPMFGQLGYFQSLPARDYEDKRPLDRYLAEARRLLGVLDGRLAGRDWIMRRLFDRRHLLPAGRNATGLYEARELPASTIPNAAAWLERGRARPAVARGHTGDPLRLIVNGLAEVGEARPRARPGVGEGRRQRPEEQARCNALAASASAATGQQCPSKAQRSFQSREHRSAGSPKIRGRPFDDRLEQRRTATAIRRSQPTTDRGQSDTPAQTSWSRGRYVDQRALETPELAAVERDWSRTGAV